MNGQRGEVVEVTLTGGERRVLGTSPYTELRAGIAARLLRTYPDAVTCRIGECCYRVTDSNRVARCDA